MSQATDLLLDEHYDLLLSGGDLVVDAADEQHVALLLLTEKGEWRQSPATGVGLRRHQAGPMDAAEQAALSREIRIQLERDGYQVNAVAVSAAAALTLDAFRP